MIRAQSLLSRVVLDQDQDQEVEVEIVGGMEVYDTVYEAERD